MEKVENVTFSEWVKNGLFASLQVDVETLLNNQEAIFRRSGTHLSGQRGGGYPCHRVNKPIS